MPSQKFLELLEENQATPGVSCPPGQIVSELLEENVEAVAPLQELSA